MVRVGLLGCGSLARVIVSYAKLDVDTVSVGELTHSVESFDVSLKVVK